MRAPFYFPVLLTSSLYLFLSSLAFGGVSGVEFAPDEIARNAENAKLISNAASSCLAKTWNSHLEFHKKRGYSKYFGDRHPKHKTAAGRKAVILALLPQLEARVLSGEAKALEELEVRMNELKNISCVGLAMECLGVGFQQAGMKDTWDKIYAWLGRKGEDGQPMFYGTDLQKALVDLGWKSLYWNADLSQNEEWDTIDKIMNPLKEGKQWNPVWGGHAYRWALVKKNKEYYGVPVHDVRTLVNFGVNGSAEFKQVPFFVGTAHAGYHVFPGFGGQVIEAHSMRELRSRENLEVGPFNPLNQELNGVSGGTGAPRWTKTEHYKSGVIVVPPGFIADKPFEAPPSPLDAPRSPMPEGQDGYEDESDRRRRYEEHEDDSWRPRRRDRDRDFRDWDGQPNPGWWPRG